MTLNQLGPALSFAARVRCPTRPEICAVVCDQRTWSAVVRTFPLPRHSLRRRTSSIPGGVGRMCLKALSEAWQGFWGVLVRGRLDQRQQLLVGWLAKEIAAGRISHESLPKPDDIPSRYV